MANGFGPQTNPPPALSALPAVDRLLAAATEDGQDSDALLDMIWRTWISHPRLPGGLQVWRHIDEILYLIPTVMGPDVDMCEISAWSAPLRWLTTDPEKLAIRLFPGESRSSSRDQRLYLQSEPPNPTINRGISRSGLYSALWVSHPIDRLRIPFRVLQSHVLLAQASIMRALYTAEQWRRGDPPHRAFTKWFYSPGLHIRRLAEAVDGSASVIREAAVTLLPINCSRECYPDQLEAVASNIALAEEFLRNDFATEDKRARAIASLVSGVEDFDDVFEEPHASAEDTDRGFRFSALHEISRGLRNIAKFCRWGLNPVLREPGSGHGKGGNPSGGQKVISGAGDEFHTAPIQPDVLDQADLPGANASLEEVDEATDTDVLIGDPEDTESPPVAIVAPYRWIKNAELHAAVAAAGDYPGEHFAEQPLQLVNNAAGVSFANSGALEMANQLLSGSYEDLAAIEVANLLCQLEHVAQSSGTEMLELFALVNVSFSTGSSLERSMKLMVLENETPEMDCDLALVLRGSQASWRLRALKTEIASTSVHPCALPVERFIELPDELGASIPVRKYIEELRREQKLESSYPMCIFLRDQSWYRRQLKEVVGNRGRATWTKIARVMFQRVIDRTGGDKVYASLVTSTKHRLSEVGRHYATVPIRKLQELYMDCCNSLRHDLAQGGYELPRLESASLADPSEFVGSPLCPSMTSFRDMGRELRAILSASGPWTIARHNAYVCYVLQMFAVAAAMRGVSSPLQLMDLIDSRSGYTMINDKEFGDHKGRLVWLPERVIVQLLLHESYLVRLAASKPIPSGNLSFYFLDEEETVEEVRPATIMKRLLRWLPAANAARHLTYSFLQDRGSPELRDALCGHFSVGEAPYAKWSSFRYPAYEDEMRVLLEGLLRELEFEPIGMPSLWSL